MSPRPFLERWGRWLWPIGYMAVIFYFSSLPNPMPAVTSRIWDKLIHVVEYAALGALLARALLPPDQGARGSHGRSVLAAILLASAYGATDEYHQSFVLGRQGDLLDWAADSTGGCAGAMAYAARMRRWLNTA